MDLGNICQKYMTQPTNRHNALSQEVIKQYGCNARIVRSAFMDLVVKMRDELYFTQAQNVSWIITDPECDNQDKHFRDRTLILAHVTSVTLNIKSKPELHAKVIAPGPACLESLYYTRPLCNSSAPQRICIIRLQLQHVTFREQLSILADPTHTSCGDPGTPLFGNQNNTQGYQV